MPSISPPVADDVKCRRRKREEVDEVKAGEQTLLNVVLSLTKVEVVAAVVPSPTVVASSKAGDNFHH